MLQVAGVPTLNDVYTNFVAELEKNSIVRGKNLVVNRAVIDFDVEKAGLWKKARLLLKLKGEVSRIAAARLDLAMTIGTPATLYTKDKIISTGVPLVFSGVSFPVSAGCRPLTEAGPGFTGSTTYMNPKDALQIAHIAFPRVTIFGMVHSDDNAAVTHADDIKGAASELGQRPSSSPWTPTTALRNNEPATDLSKVLDPAGIPSISFVYTKVPGSALYAGFDFGYVGGLSSQQTVRILKDKPGQPSDPEADGPQHHDGRESNREARPEHSHAGP